ncbi:hypothetical protein VCR14J2_300496 [Vibrio coralliirubri]|nr:hypothetical protein VCR14J2_300496 [Vibrio coralliirubri]
MSSVLICRDLWIKVFKSFNRAKDQNLDIGNHLVEDSHFMMR